MYTIKEVAKIMDVSEHTLRFWAKNGLFPEIKRDQNNVRLFNDNDLEWVKIVKCLRKVGTDNKSIKRYIDLCLVGDSTLKERYQIILDTKAKALNQMQDLKNQLEVLDYKQAFYENLIKNNLSDPWNPANKIQQEKEMAS